MLDIRRRGEFPSLSAPLRSMLMLAIRLSSFGSEIKTHLLHLSWSSPSYPPRRAKWSVPKILYFGVRYYGLVASA